MQPSLFVFLKKSRALTGYQGTRPDVVRIDRAEHTRRILRVPAPALPAAQIGHPVLGKLKTGGHRFFAAFNLLLAGNAFADDFQNFIIARFQTDMNAVQTRFTNRDQFLQLPLRQRF